MTAIIDDGPKHHCHPLKLIFMGSASETFKQTGDMVSATDIVVVGRNYVQVRPAA